MSRRKFYLQNLISDQIKKALGGIENFAICWKHSQKKHL